jgi:hypothetical protein
MQIMPKMSAKTGKADGNRQKAASGLCMMGRKMGSSMRSACLQTVLAYSFLEKKFTDLAGEMSAMGRVRQPTINPF